MKFGLLHKFLFFLLVVFAFTGYGVFHYQTDMLVSCWLSEKSGQFKAISWEMGKAVGSVKDLSGAGPLADSFNAAAAVSETRILITDTLGLVYYDSYAVHRNKLLGDTFKPLTRNEPVREPEFSVVISKNGKTEYIPIKETAAALGVSHRAELYMTAPLHPDRPGDGCIIIRASMKGLQEKLAENRNHMVLFVTVWFALVAAAFAALMKKAVIAPLHALIGVAGAVSRKDFSQRTEFNTGDEISLVGKSINTMLYNIEKDHQEALERNDGLIHMSSELEMRNQELQRKQKLIDSDLRLAHEIQQELMPQVYPKIEGVRIAAVNFQVGEIGGDCFDFYKLSDKKLAAFIGDVSGKGISAALVMAMATILFSQIKDSHSRPDEILSMVNDVMHRHFGKQHSIYLTCFFMVLDVETMTLTYSCAGHNPPFVFRKGEDEVQQLVAEGFGLGMFAGVNYEVKTFALRPGDKLILYTDGVVESRNSAGELLGSEAFIEMVKGYANVNSFQLIHNLIEDVGEYAGAAKRQDDLTLLVVELEES